MTVYNLVDSYQGFGIRCCLRLQVITLKVEVKFPSENFEFIKAWPFYKSSDFSRLRSVQTGCGAHPASCSMDIGWNFSWRKAAGTWRWSSNCRINNARSYTLSSHAFIVLRLIQLRANSPLSYMVLNASKTQLLCHACVLVKLVLQSVLRDVTAFLVY
jgi:hypothetical protein